ncbi:MAG: hypothetical protein FJ138_06040 [Deltaproteobacteria bacterium]|nr:hypothetical protein [Deltaproteobacteria bacterium]
MSTSRHLQTTVLTGQDETLVAPPPATLPSPEPARAEPPAAEPPPRYQTLSRLGEGGMGVVDRCYDAWLQRSVALKRLKPAAPAGPAGARPALSAAQRHRAALFVREARVLAQLNHPNIVPVYDLSPEGDPFFTMEELSGVTLDALLEELRGADAGSSFQRFDALLRHLLSVCEAVSYAHGKGVLHRDLKPSNVIITHHGVARVIDWGLGRLAGRDGDDAREEASAGAEGAPPAPAPAPTPLEALANLHATLTGSLSGTPLYMSPEQARGEPLDERSDVFSLGVMLYELVAGRSPHERDGALPPPLALVDALRRGEPLPPLSAARCVHPHLHAPALADACARALAPRREERTASAAALGAALSAHLSGEARRAEAAVHVEEARALYGAWRGALGALSAPQEPWARALQAPPSAAEEALRERLLNAFELAYQRDPSLWQALLWRLEVRAQALEAHWALTPSARVAALGEACAPDLARLLTHRAALERDLLAARPWAAGLLADLLGALDLLARGARLVSIWARAAAGEEGRAAGVSVALSLSPLSRVEEPAPRAGGARAAAGALGAEGAWRALSAELPVGFYRARLLAHDLETLHPLEVPPLTPPLLRAERLEPLSARLDALGAAGAGEARDALRDLRALERTARLPSEEERAARRALLRPRWLAPTRCRVGTPLPVPDSLPPGWAAPGGCWLSAAPLTLAELAELLSALRAARLALAAAGAAAPYADEHLLIPVTQFPFKGLEGLPAFELAGSGAQEGAQEAPRYALSASWREVGYTEDRPAVWINFFLALSVATWRSWRDELLVELPHELEWEAAARGPDGRLFPWGDLCDARLSLNRVTTEGMRLRIPPPPDALAAAYPLDESPCELTGLAGGVADWCWASERERDDHRALLVDMIEERRRLARAGASEVALWGAFVRSPAWRACHPQAIQAVPPGEQRLERIFKVARGGTLVNPLERCALPYRFRSLVHKSYADVGVRLAARPLPARGAAEGGGP